MSWLAILSLSAGAFAAKALGLLGGERMRIGRLDRWLELLPVALLAALVVVQTLDGGRRLVLDERLLGVTAGGVAAWRKLPFAIVVAIAAATTAIARTF